MRIDLGDAPAWAALAVSAGALFVAIRSNRHAEDSAVASQDSAISARRSAEAAERQAAAAEAALPPPPPPVEWQVLPAGKQHSYVLRHAGTHPALAVEIDDAGQMVRPVGSHSLAAAQLEPGESIAFWVLDVDQLPTLREIRVRWDGSGDWVILPLPSGPGG